MSRQFNIARGTLQNKVAGTHGEKPGHPTVLTEVEENCIVQHLVRLADWGFPMDNTDLCVFIKTYLDKVGKNARMFTSNYTGVEWAHGFLKRHRATLRPRMCQNISSKRAQVDKQSIDTYFSNLEVSLKDIPPENIVNYDETNLTDDPGRRQAIFRRGTKYPVTISVLYAAHNHLHIIVL